jgi:pimeloyl-ACP methyl ester carboxylesterase
MQEQPQSQTQTQVPTQVQMQVRGRPASAWRAGRFGAGRPRLLMIHGVAASSFIWTPLAARLADEFELWAIDLPGAGATPIGAENGPFGYAGFVVDCMDALGLDSVDAVLGHSMGGAVALELALLVPERVRGLMIFNAAPMLPRLVRLALRTPGIPALIGLSDLASAPLKSNRLLAQLYLRRIFGESETLTREVVEGYARLAEAPDFYRNMARALRGFAQHHRRSAELSAIRVPVSIVWGERDPIFPLKIAQKLVKTLPRASLHRLPRVGHCPPQEVPETIAELVRELLSRIGREDWSAHAAS